jgi:IS5 family transposase
MGRAAGFFDVEDRLAGLSKKGDDLERLAAVVDFELFRRELERAVPRADRSKGGRPPFDHVLMFKVLILQTQNNLSDERTEFYLRDRLTWMRFLGLGLGDAVPDANTIWTFRETLTRAGAAQRLFELFDRELRAKGYLAMSGQLVDASIISAPKQHLTRTEKPHASTRLADLLDPANTASGVWADSGYRSKKNEDLLGQRMLKSHIHRKKPQGRPMPERTARANAKKSAVRARIEHVLAEQKVRMVERRRSRAHHCASDAHGGHRADPGGPRRALRGARPPRQAGPGSGAR